MPTATTIHITARTFTGKLFPIDVEPTHTVDELKALIVAAGKGKSVKVPGLEYKGHELRDTRRVDHYGLVANDVLHIVPPSKVPKIALELEREDGSVFDITVSTGITVAKLKEEIKIEEKIPVRQLKLVNSQEDEDGDEVVTLLEMQDEKAISEYTLEGQKVLVDDSVWEAISAPSAIGILVSIDDRIEDAERNRIGVAVRLDQTLGSFKELLLNKHAFPCAEHSLIFIGRELKDDQQTLGDLGFIEGCTIHAVVAVQFSVATQADEDYEFALKATTRISEIRKLLREVDADVGDRDDYAFSLDGVHTLRESRTLWDLNIYSGTTFILKDRHLITLSIHYFGLTSIFRERLGTELDSEIHIDDSASLDDLRAQILGMMPSLAKETFQPPNWVSLTHRRKPLRGTRTIKEERLEGGDVVEITLYPPSHGMIDEPDLLHGLQQAEGGSEDAKNGALFGSNTAQPGSTEGELFESTDTPLLPSESWYNETGTERPVRQDESLSTLPDEEQDQIQEESHDAAPPGYVKRDPAASLLSQTQPQDDAEDVDADPDDELDVYFDAKAHILP